MNKRTLFFAAAVILLVPFSPPAAFSQERDIDEQRLEIGKTGIDEARGVEAPLIVNKEEKYIAGKDKKWFTVDDAIYHFSLIEHDRAGNIFKKSCYTIGKDRIPYTKDDKLQDYVNFDYGPDGKVRGEEFFNAKGVKQYSAKYSYDKEGRKIKVTRYNTKRKEIRSIAFVYDEKGHLMQDIEYVPQEIEKYHRFDHDDNGNMIRAMEYHVDHKGKGPDGVWFTADDVISSTKQCTFSPDGSKNQENKYIEPGPDGKWFTDDDVMQYYVLFEYH